MKARLLKKVRRRFEIEKIISLGTDPSDMHKHVAKNLGLPFYAVYDNHDGFGMRSEYKKTFDEAYESLRAMIRGSYAHEVKKLETRREKVWYNK